jgi:Flp pilus assembly pilin Flp
MHPIARPSPALAVAVRAQIAAADVRDAVLDSAQRRVARLRDDGETGAQAAEYAMLGGVSAAACGGLIALLKNREFLQRVLEAVISALTKVIRSWF